MTKYIKIEVTLSTIGRKNLVEITIEHYSIFISIFSHMYEEFKETSSYWQMFNNITIEHKTL